MDGVRLSGGEHGGNKGPAIGRQELNGEEEDDGEEEKPDGAEKLGDSFGYGLALVAEKEGHEDDQRHHNY